jgi:hypothetical protein
MKIYDYEPINKCVLYGSIENGLDKFIENVIIRLPHTQNVSKEIHPKEAERQERLKRKEEERLREQVANPFVNPLGLQAPTFDSSRAWRKKMRPSVRSFLNDTIVIVCGNCGLGSKDTSFYISKFNNFNTVLSDNNCHVLFVRGNSDNPSLFNNEEINLSNVKTVPDYSIVKFKSFNCLCLGGSISLDREWKKAQQERIGRKLYWEDENFVYNEKAIDSILEDYDIACIVSSTCPSFAFPGTNSFNKSSWALKDKSLLEDILNERRLMDKVYEKIISKNKKPYTWFYTKYKANHNNIVNDILFQSLGKQETYSFNDCVSANFGVNFDSSTKISYNKEVMDELIKKIESIGSEMPNAFDVEEDDVENGELIGDEEVEGGEPMEGVDAVGVANDDDDSLNDIFGGRIDQQTARDYINTLLNGEEVEDAAVARREENRGVLNQIFAADAATAAAGIQEPRIEYEPIRGGQVHFEMPNYLGGTTPNR